MRRIDVAPLIAALGGLILFVSLFLHWYEPGLSAWTVFEVLDLVLAALALGAIAVGASALGVPLGARDRALPWLGGAAFVVVVSQLVNHPPAAQSGSPLAGAWLGLAGATLMAVGGILQATGVSLDLSIQPGRSSSAAGPPAAPARRPAPSSPANEAAAVEPEVHDELYPEQPRRGPIGANDPEPWTAAPDDETLAFEEPDREEGT